ncbi:MAG: cytochrome P450 [Pseudomonadota bacterium]
MALVPPKPASRPDDAGVLERLRLFRGDLFASQPDRLYDARMAEVKTPFYNSYLVNEPEIAREVLVTRAADFDKSEIMGTTLRPLLGRSVFVANGAAWARARRIIDPAFEGGRLRQVFPAMHAAAVAAAERLAPMADGRPVEVQFETTHLTADVIFRTLFSIPIEDRQAARIYDAFQAYQRAQPLANLADLMRLPSWVPRFRSRRERAAAAEIRAVLEEVIRAREGEIAAGTAPDDLATKIMTTEDPEDGTPFTRQEMVDQLATFFLAGHETSASALAWALWLLASDPAAQERVAEEAAAFAAAPDLSASKRLTFTRDVIREALRLYPPVPVIMRDARRPESWRKRAVKPGSMVMISAWHMQRHRRLWSAPDAFDPDRWQREDGKASAREAYLPFSMGARVCPGAGFAMLEAVIALAVLLPRYRLAPLAERPPRPVAHLTVRAAEGVWLSLTPRQPPASAAPPP